MKQIKNPEILALIHQYNTSWEAIFGPDFPSPYSKVIEYINQIENMNIELQNQLEELKEQMSI
jgi:hypothetical protein